MPAAVPYDEMEAEGETAEEETEEAAAEGALDDELLMHAEAAGLDEAKAAAMKLFVERCVELKGSGGYVAPEEEEGLDDLL